VVNHNSTGIKRLVYVNTGPKISNKQGTETTSHNILNQLNNENIDELYVSFDIDTIDDNYASDTVTSEPDG